LKKRLSPLSQRVTVTVTVAVAPVALALAAAANNGLQGPT
jgi:hypothetical protein